MKDDVALITMMVVVVIELRSIQHIHLKEDNYGLILEIKNEKKSEVTGKCFLGNRRSVLDILNLSFP